MVWLTEAAVIAAMNAVSLVKMENIEDMLTYSRFIVDMVEMLEVVYMELMVDIWRVPLLTCFQEQVG